MSAQLARRFLILGAPGSGKSTIAERIIKTYALPHIVVGNLLRQQIQQRSDDSRTIKEHIDKGILVPDEIVLRIMIEEMEKVSEKGFLLEGYPRNLNQAEALHRQIRVHHAIALNVSSDEIRQRLKDRWVHFSSGRIYNSKWKPPKEPGKDDVTNEPLAQPEDDRETILRYRLATFDRNINPVKEFYRQLGALKEFSGRDSDQIWSNVKAFIDGVLK